MKSSQTILTTTLLIASQLVLAQSGCIESFKNPQRNFPHNEAKATNIPFVFDNGEPLGNISYRVRGESRDSTMDEYFGKFCTTGFFVLHKGKVVFERYMQGVRSDDALLSASMSKTILSLLIGIAISEGKISLNDRVKDVLSDFKDSAFADVTVEELLRMNSGVKLRNSYARGELSDNQAINPMIYPRQDMRAYLRKKIEFDKSATKFDYNGAMTALLGLVLSTKTGMTNTAYLSQKLWSEMGAKSSGYWIKNLSGQEGVQGQFATILSDYARLGYLVMNKGYMNGKQIVPKQWIEEMTTVKLGTSQPAEPPYYGLHVWIPQSAGGRSFFWGVNGQNIFVDPIAQVVIVHTGNSPDAKFHGNAHLFPLRDAIVAKLHSR